MITRIKTTLTSLIALFVVAAPVAMPVSVYAGAPTVENGLCNGVNLQITDECNIEETGQQGTDKINDIIRTVIDIFSLVVGIVSVIMIIIGGLKYITSGGDSGNVTGAKNTILYAVIGLVVVALAQFIVKFVLGKATTAGN